MAEQSRKKRAAVTRRQFLKVGGIVMLGGTVAGPMIRGLAEETVTMPFANGKRPLV